MGSCPDTDIDPLPYSNLDSVTHTPKNSKHGCKILTLGEVFTCCKVTS